MNLMDINIDAFYNILKQNQGDVSDTMGLKKKTVVVTSDPLALIAEKTKTDDKKVKNKDDEKKRDMGKVKCYNCKKKGHFAKDCKKVKVKDYEYYKTKMLLAKIGKDEQVFLAGNQAWMESSSDSDQDINANMVFMAQIEKVLSDSEASSSSADDKISEVSYYISESESESEYETSEYYDNTNTYGLFVNDNDDQTFFHDCETFPENLIESQINHNESADDHNNSEGVDKDLKNTVLEKDFKISELEECVRNKDLEIEKCLKCLHICENKLHKMGQTNQTVHMIMHSKDNMYNGRKEIGFENPNYFCKAKDLRPTLYDEGVINLGYTLMFLTYSDEALEIEKFKRMMKWLVFWKNKKKLKTIESSKSDDVETGVHSSEKVVSKTENKSENDCQEIEKVYDRKENPNVIATGMFKLSVSQSVSPISVSKTSCDSKNVENKTKRKRHLDNFSSVRRPKQSSVIWKKKMSSNTSHVDLSSVSHLKLNKDVTRYSRKDLLSCNNSHLEETSIAYVCNDVMNVSCNSRLCDSFDENNLFIFDDESVRISPVSKMTFRNKPRDSKNVCSKSNSNKYLPRTVHRWLPKMQPLAEPVAKWIPKIVQICLWIIDSRCSKHMTGNRALLTNFVEKFLGTVRFGNNYFAVIAGYGDVVIGSTTIKKVYYVEGLGHNLFSVGQFCDKGLEVGFRKSTCFVRNEDGVDLLTGDRLSNLYTIALNEVVSNSLACLLAKASSSQSWLWHQRLSHLNFATINNLVKNNLVQGLPKMKLEKDYLCSACEQGKIHQKHHKSKTTFASNKPLHLLHLDLCGPMRVESINGKRYVLVVVDDYSRYTWVFFLHSKDEASDVISSFIKKTRVNLQLQVQRVRIDNGTEFKNKTLAKFFDEAGITQQFSASRTPQQNGVVERACFTQNRLIIYKRFDKTPYELMNKRKPNIKFFRVFGCRCYLLNDYEDVGKLKAKGDIGVFVGYSKESVAFRIYNKQSRKIHETFMKSSTTNVETSNVEITSNEEEVFFESSELFQEESSSSSLNDDVQQSSKEVGVPSSNTQTISNNMIHNVDEASTSHNMFNKRLDDAYFDTSTSFHDPSNVHTFYQLYPHEKKWTKDHPLHKIIGDPKSSVRTRGQLENSCLFSCLLSSIEPANVAEALRDADWVSAMQDELDQFARLKVWRLVPRPEGKTIIKTKWIFKNKKDEINLVIRNKARLVAVVSTPMVEPAKLKLDLVGKPIDHTDYQSMMGSLMYVTSSRPDIMFDTCMCARYQANPNEHHVSTVKRIFHYLKGTINLGLWYPKDFGFDLPDYSDADHARCHLDQKSTADSVQFLGDKLVCWSSKKQNCVSISTAEFEYVAVSSCCAQVLWMRTQLTDYGFFYDKVPIYYDSNSAIAISCNPVQHIRTKHIDVRYHFIKYHVEKGMIELYFLGTEYQLADLFTKSLPEARFKFLVEKLGMMSRET
nr:hypothetical protein [Tanacetum cinerariifolium]